MEKTVIYKLLENERVNVSLYYARSTLYWRCGIGALNKHLMYADLPDEGRNIKIIGAIDRFATLLLGIEQPEADYINEFGVDAKRLLMIQRDEEKNNLTKSRMLYAIFHSYIMFETRPLSAVLEEIQALYQLNARVELFCECYCELNDRSDLFSLWSTLRTKAKHKEFRQKQRMQHACSQRNIYSLTTYINKLLSRSSEGYYIQRIDLGYDNTGLVLGCMWSHMSRLMRLKHDWYRFTNNMKHNPDTFGRLAGYIWKLGFNWVKGLHYHVVLFIDPCTENSELDALRIAENWAKCVSKQGQKYSGRIATYWLTGTHPDNYHRLANGFITSSSISASTNRANELRDLVTYLGCRDQHWVPKGLLYEYPVTAKSNSTETTSTTKPKRLKLKLLGKGILSPIRPVPSANLKSLKVLQVIYGNVEIDEKDIPF